MSAVLTSIEKTAADLDAFRKTRLRETSMDVVEAYMQAREKDQALIKPAEDFRDMLHDEFHGAEVHKGRVLPWHTIGDKFRIRRGELTVWAGFNGHMKSMVTGFVMLDLLHQGERGLVASFEMKPRKTLRRLACQSIGTQKPTAEYIDKFLDSVSGKLWLYDQQGEVEAERLFGVIVYAAEKLGITQFIVDSLMKVVKDEDDYNGQKRLVGRLQSLARDLNVHIHLITHSRKREDETKRPGKQDNKGSGSIVDQTDNFVAVFKLPPPKDVKEGETSHAPTHCLYFDKQRNGEWEGLIALWLDEQSLQFKEKFYDKARRYV
jgi:twinkle protein